MSDIDSKSDTKTFLHQPVVLASITSLVILVIVISTWIYVNYESVARFARKNIWTFDGLKPNYLVLFLMCVSWGLITGLMALIGFKHYYLLQIFGFVLNFTLTYALRKNPTTDASIQLKADS